MSGSIRQWIVSAKARLKSHLQELRETLVPQLDPEAPVNETCDQLKAVHYQLSYDITRIQRQVTTLQEKDAEWERIMKIVQPGEPLLREEELHRRAADGEDGYVAIMTKGQEVLDVLNARLREVDGLLTQQNLRAAQVQEGGGEMGKREELQSQPSQQEQQLKEQPPLQQQQREFLQAWQPQQQGADHAPGFWRYHQALDHGQPYDKVPYNLPKLPLPEFDGQILQFRQYWDSFKAAIHDRPIEPVQKFNYLLSTLKGKAADAVQGLAVTNANYEQAINILRRRFGDPAVIKQHLYTQLRNVPTSSTRIADLRQTFEETERIFRQLESMGEDLTQPRLIIDAQEKYPAEVLVELGRCKLAHESWQLDQLRFQLESLICTKEEALRISQSVRETKEKPAQASPAQQDFGRNRVNQNQPSAAGTFAVTANIRPRTIRNRVCAFCEGGHYDDQCFQFKTPKMRQERAWEKRLCYRCLQSGDHMAHECPVTTTCYYCQGPHNRALCFHQKQFEGGLEEFPTQNGPGGAQRYTATARYAPQNGTYGGSSQFERGPYNRTPQQRGGWQQSWQQRSQQSGHQSWQQQWQQRPQQQWQQPSQQQQQGSVPPTSIAPQPTAATTEVHGDTTWYSYSATGPVSEVNEVASQTTAAMKKAKKQSGIQLLMTKTTTLTPDGTSEEHAVLFFDGGSQRSYMKRELMKKLGLRPQRYEKLSLYTFASAKPQHVTAPVVQFDLKQKNGTLTRMEVCVLPQLVNPIQTQTLEPGDLQVIQSSLGWNT